MEMLHLSFLPLSLSHSLTQAVGSVIELSDKIINGEIMVSIKL